MVDTILSIKKYNEILTQLNVEFGEGYEEKKEDR